MQPRVIHSASESFSPILKKGYVWRFASAFALLICYIITRKYYTKLCTIYWSSYHGSSAKLLQYR